MPDPLPDPAAGEPPTLTHAPDAAVPPAPAGWERAPLGRIGEFDLLDNLGRDGPFQLYRAIQTRLNRTVVLKVPPADAPDSDSLAALLAREAEATARFDHPGIVRVVESGTADGRPYLALAEVEGESLAERIARGPVPDRLAADWARQLAETLFIVHAAGQLHVNLRPEYVHIGRDGQVRLSGFGTAGRPDEGHGYLAPERLPRASRGTDARTDVYGLGAVLYAMLAARPPFRANRPAALARKIREAHPQPPRKVRRGISRDLQAICLMCLSKNPYRRYGDVGGMARVIADLRRFLSHKPVTARDADAPERLWLWARRNRRVLLAAAFVVISVGASAGWDRYQSEIAWHALTDPATPADRRDRAVAYWTWAGEVRPHDPEVATAAALAHLRAGEPTRALAALPGSNVSSPYPNSYSSYLSEPTIEAPGSARWRTAWVRLQALAHLEEGKYGPAKSVAQSASQPGPDDARPELTAALAGELRAKLTDGDRLARAVDASDPEAIRDVAAVTPTAELVRALLWQAVHYSPDQEAETAEPTSNRRANRSGLWLVDEAQQALDKIPEWSKSDGARRAIRVLVLATVSPDGRIERAANELLGRINPDWRRSPEARTAISRLVSWLACDPEQGPAPGRVRDLLAWLDANWAKSAEARAASPLLVDLFYRRVGGNEVRVWWVLDTLTLLGPTAADITPVLRESLTDPREFVRSFAFAALAVVERDWAGTDWGPPAFADLLARCGSTEPAARRVTVQAIGRLSLPEDDRVVRALVTALPEPLAEAALVKIDPDWPASAAARSALPDLVRHLTRAEPVDRVHSAYALSRFGPAALAARPALLGLLPDCRSVSRDMTAAARDWLHRGQPNRTVNAGAIRALDEIDPMWAGSPAARERVPVLVAVLADEDDREHGDGLRVLRSTLDRIDPAWARSPAAGEAAARLATRLNHADPRVRRQAIAGLSRFGPSTLDLLGEKKEAVSILLVERLADDDQSVRQEAGRTAGVLVPDWETGVVGQKAAEFFIRQLGSGQAAGAAAETVARVQPPVTTALPALIDQAAELAYSDYEPARRALAVIDPKWRESDATAKAVPRLAERLADPKASARAEAAWVLAEVGPLTTPVLPRLAQALADKESSDVRERAARAMRATGEKAARYAPELAAADSREALVTLRELGPKAAAGAPVLITRLGDRHFDLNAGIQTLAAIAPDWQTSPKVDEMIPVWARQLGTDRHADGMAVLKRLAPLGNRARLAVDVVGGLRPIFQKWPSPSGRRGSWSERNTYEVIEAVEFLELLGPIGPTAVGPLVNRLVIPLDKDEVYTALRNEIDAVWRALPKMDPEWMWREEVDRAMETWVLWKQGDGSNRARLQAGLAADWMKQVEEARAAARKQKGQ